jgi:hypothetical protein
MHIIDTAPVTLTVKHHVLFVATNGAHTTDVVCHKPVATKAFVTKTFDETVKAQAQTNFDHTSSQKLKHCLVVNRQGNRINNLLCPTRQGK